MFLTLFEQPNIKYQAARIKFHRFYYTVIIQSVVLLALLDALNNLLESCLNACFIAALEVTVINISTYRCNWIPEFHCANAL